MTRWYNASPGNPMYKSTLDRNNNEMSITPTAQYLTLITHKAPLIKGPVTEYKPPCTTGTTNQHALNFL